MAEFLAKITSKGQLTLPVSVRRSLGVGEGDYVRLEPVRGGGFLLKAGPRASELSGLISYSGPARTVEEIRSASRATFDK